MDSLVKTRDEHSWPAPAHQSQPPLEKWEQVLAKPNALAVLTIRLVAR